MLLPTPFPPRVPYHTIFFNLPRGGLYLEVGEIARAAAIFEVDEIVVYDDLSVSRKGHGGVLDDSSTGGSGLVSGVAGAGGGVFAAGDAGRHDRNNPNVFMARLLQVCVRDC